MAYPPRHGHGMPPMPFMGMPNVPPPGMPPIPPNMMSAPPPAPGATSLPFFSGPPPVRGANQRFNSSHIIQGKPTVHHSLPSDHPSPIPMKNVPMGPPITVFVGNITDKWPDAMIRQLLSTCGHVINWKRVQGASGKLQGFGFCEFNGPDSGLRAVRMLHDLEVGDKKLVVKVDAKTNSILEDYKAERRKKKEKEPKPENSGEEPKEGDDYMDSEMVEIDERAKARIENLFREFKSDLESYVPQGSDKPEKDPAAKQAIQDKLHLLKLTSLDAPPSDADASGDAVVEEGKREIISQEITRFREHMKLEKEREEERKRITKERREREEREKLKVDQEGQKSPSQKRKSRSKSPLGRILSNRSPGPRSRSRSRLNDFRRERDRRSRERDRDRRNRSRERVNRDFRDRDRRRSRDRKSPSRGRDRSPILAPHKRKFREREEEEEAEEQRKRERKAREKLASYEERVRQWEQREEKKRRDRKKELERKQQALEDMAREAKKMKQFLQDYEDDKLDPKYYKGKELQKRLSDRAKELEMDNKDRQRERDEVEEMRLRLLTSGGGIQGSSIIPVITLDKGLKKPILDTTNHSQFQILGNKRPISQSSTTASRLQALAGLTGTSISQSNGVTKTSAPSQPKVTEKPPTSFSGVHFPGKAKSPNLSASSLVSPGGPPVEMSPSLKSLEKTGFSVSLSNHSSLKEDDTRQSFTSTNSPGMGSPGNSYRDDDSSLQDMSPDDLKKKKAIDVKDVFNQDDDDDGLGSARKRKLVPLDYGDAKLRKEEKAAEEKKKHVKSLIDRIPTEKDALFSYEVDWTMVDDTLIEKRMRPWINKKIVEYIGEPEPTLVDFICAKVLAKSNPTGILEDVQMVLDEEADVFVVKMWRLLVYEIEAKKMGLASKAS